MTQRADAAGRSLSEVWDDPNLCFNMAEATNSEEGYLLPIKNVLNCLRKVRLDQDFAVTAVEAYRDVFAAGY